MCCVACRQVTSRVDFNHTVPGENKSHMEMHNILICSSATFYFHSLAIECTSAMPVNVHHVYRAPSKCESTELVSICFLYS